MRPFKHLSKAQIVVFTALGLGLSFALSPVVFSQEKISAANKDLDVRTSSLISEKSAAGPHKDKPLNTQALGSPAGFGSGFNAATPPWTVWQMPSVDEGPYDNFYTPNPKIIAPQSLDVYKTTPNDNGFIIAAKMDDMIRGVSPAVVALSSSSTDARTMPEYMMRLADGMVLRTNSMYQSLQAMFADIGNMQTQLNHNYDTWNHSNMTAELADQFNAKSDEMAGRVSGMRSSMDGMTARVTGDRDLLDGMFGILDQLNGSAKGQSDVVLKHIKDASARFELMARDLKAQDLDAEKSIADVRQYLANLSEYVQDTKAYNASIIDYTHQARKYLQDIRSYLDKVLADLKKTSGDLKANEDYFRKAKVEAGSGGENETELSSADACADLSKKLKKSLTSQRECQKSCRTVCRGHGQGCFECPSGSPDSCTDVGGQPPDFSWCKPGGFCYDDPNMVCVPFGAKGPQGEHLQCTNCKERPDECSVRVDINTTNLTHCIQTCWDGVCVYKGKYKNQEWDGKPEFMHCYECKRPPAPPTCEQLKWGATWKSDCEKTCPAPGTCEAISMPSGKPAGKNPPAGNPPGGKPDGQCDGPVCGGVAGGGQTDAPQGGQTGGGHTVSGGKPASGATDGTNPQPPTDGPTTGGPGGGTIAGNQDSPTVQPETKPTQAGGTTQPGPSPTTTAPNQPSPPATEKPNPPPPPPNPPTTPEIEFYQKWLTETKERIKSREDIINNPNEGTTVREDAQKQLDGMKWWETYLEDRIKKLQDAELAKQQAAEDLKKKQEEYERTRPRTRSYAEEAARRGLEWKLNRLKTATDALKAKLQEMKDALTGRKEHLDRLKNEIEELKAENNHFTVSRDQNGMDKDFANTRIKQNEDRIKELQKLYNDLAKKLQEAQKKFAEELEPLKTEYQRALWSVDEGSRRRAESSRIEEYFEKWDELQRKEQMRKVRNDTFDSMVKNLEGARDAARAGGDTSSADEFQRQIDNIRRGQAEWDASQERQINTLKDEIRDIENRNIYEGVGPGSPEDLGHKLAEYGKIFQDRLTGVNNQISELEKMGGTRTAEQNKQLDALKAQAQGLQGAIDGVNAKQQVFTSGDKLTAEDIQRVHDTATRVAAGAMNKDADKSFAQLAAESIVEEAVHNLNPYVMAKKSLAFGVGIVQGVGTAVGGLVKLGWEAVDTVGESVMVDLGFSGGGIFGTENLDSIIGMTETVNNNMNFDGVLKAVVAAGGAIDAKITELSRGDIDWGTSNFGGQMVGENFVGPEVASAALGAGLSKARTLIKGGEEAAEVATVTGKTPGRIEEAAAAGNTTERGAGMTGAFDETVRIPPPEGVKPPGTFERPVSAGETPSAPTKVEPRAPPENAPTTIERPAGETPSAPTKVEPRPFENPPPDSAPTKVQSKPGTIERPVVENPPPDSAPTKIGNPPPESAPTKVSPAEPAPAAKPGGAAVAEESAEATRQKRLQRAGIDENTATSFTGPDGKRVDITVGEELGHGSTSTVFADPNDPTKAIRITKPGGINGAGSERAAALDAAGRKAVESIQKPGGPIRIVEPGTPVMVNDPASPLNGRVVEIVERFEPGAAKGMIEAQGGTLTAGQAEALANATKELNNGGYAWMDNHVGNYGFQKVDGADKWQVVVLDPGGIVPMKGANMAERVENATALQKALNAPDELYLKLYNNGNREMIIEGARQDFMVAFADKIDAAAIGIESGWKVGYYPAGVWDFPNVQRYFK